ncbi:MAG: heavy metal translocating P-type ATPase [Vampirovibrio sp.]|nr:heavy metal translocating P-type ATPase [Vampirovibrio sp.]
MIDTKAISHESMVTFFIEGMHCASCVNRIETAVRDQVPGVRDVRVNLATHQAVVEGAISPAEIIQAIEHAGYRASVTPDGLDTHEATTTPDYIATRNRFLLSTLLTLPVFIMSMAHLDFPGVEWIQFGLTTGVMVCCGYPFFTAAFRQLRHVQANMDTLVALGTGMAYGASVATLFGVLKGPLYFESAAVIITLILLGRFLEAKAKDQAGDALRNLMALQPETVHLKQDSAFVEISIHSIAPGNILRILPGEKVPVDGVVISGESSINEAAMTGESLPVEKQAGSKVISGTLNTTGSLDIEAIQVGSETALARVIESVKAAQNSKPPVQRLVDKVAGIFVPVVMGIAVITFLIWWTLEYPMQLGVQAAVAVLVIACPCALGLATPTAIQVASGRGAQLGILFQEAQSLELAGKLTVLGLDKTGTLTQGSPAVHTIMNRTELDDETFLGWVAALESRSEHPLAKAIVAYAQAELKNTSGDDEPKIEQFHAVPGGGIVAKVDHEEWVVGSKAFLLSQAVTQSSLEKITVETKKRLGNADTDTTLDTMTQVWVGINDEAAGVFLIKDPLKDTSKDAVGQLKQMSIQPVLLTGDRQEVANAIAEQVGIDPSAVHAGVSPEEKQRVLATLKQQDKNVVMGMVGDGINDAPALAAADVSMAMGTGADVAMNTADMTLVDGDVAKAVTAIRLSRRTMQIIRQNLFWAFIYNVLAIPLAATGMLHPMIAAGAMAASSVCVVGNSLRLDKFK